MNLYQLNIGLHSGTHIDGAAHFLSHKPGIAGHSYHLFGLQSLVVDASGLKEVSESVIPDKLPKDCNCIIIKTGHAKKWGSELYFQDYPVLTDKCAQKIIDNSNVLVVGLDSPSPDKEPYNIHKLLFASGVFLLENLNSIHLLPINKLFTLRVFPLKVDADSSPARVVAEL